MKASLATLGFSCAALFSVQSYSQTYQDVAPLYNINYINQTLIPSGGGVSFVDFNNDGLDDISVATGMGDSLVFYENTGTGFTKLPPLVPFLGEAQQILWVDYDNDGDKDLYVSSNLTSNRLYRNDSNSFVNVSASAGISTTPTETYAVCWGDYNKDGWLDFYEVNQLNFGSGTNTLYLSDGAGGFTDNTSIANVGNGTHYSYGAVFFDFNNDGWQDIYLANDRQGPTSLYKNMGNGTFTDVSVQANARFIMDGMGIAVGDYDGNGYLDIYLTNTSAGNKLLRNNGDETFMEIADSMGVAFNSETWSTLFFDYDHDGDLDLHVSDVKTGPGTANTFFENVDSTFNQPPVFTGDTMRNFASALGDFNNDGYYDLVSPNHYPSALQLWESSGAGTNNWLKVKLEGVISNRDGIGSWIEVYAGTDTYKQYTHCGIGYLGQNSMTEIIGIGSNGTIDSLYVRWLSGHVDQFYQLAPGQKYNILEGSSLMVNINVAGPLHYCLGDSLFTLLNATPGFDSYLWSNGDTTSSITATAPGIYHVTATNEFGLKANSDTLAITIDSLSVIASAASDTDNMGKGHAEAIIVDGIPPFNFLWNDPLQQTTKIALNLTSGTYRVIVTDSIGCMDSAEAIVSNVMGLGETRDAAFDMFPNPAVEMVEFRVNPEMLANSTYVISIQNPLGQEVYFARAESTIPLRVSIERWSKGIYMVQLRNSETLEVMAHHRLLIY